MAQNPNIEFDRRLHFIVRDDNYAHCIGYGYFLDTALKALNEIDPPPNAEKLIERTADLFNTTSPDPMRQALRLKNYEAMARCLPNPDDQNVEGQADEIRELRKYLLPITTTPPEERAIGGQVDQAIKRLCISLFGTVCDMDFGLLRHELPFGLLSTTIVRPPHDTLPIIRTPRGYFSTLIQHYGPIDINNVPDFTLQFRYHVPNSSETLSLMRIQGYHDSTDGKAHIKFLHPDFDEKIYKTLTQRIDKLLTVIDAPKPETESDPSNERLEALAEIYWLVAQSTPIVRGGSSMANVILEHLAHRIQAKGYEKFQIPYTKEGVDLWAQAACLPLEDNDPATQVQGNGPPKLQGIGSGPIQIAGFKTRFRDSLLQARENKPGELLDATVTDDQVHEYLKTELQKLAESLNRLPKF
jgi:hypothetical protein